MRLDPECTGVVLNLELSFVDCEFVTWTVSARDHQC
jgi:hypothetical protein